MRLFLSYISSVRIKQKIHSDKNRRANSEKFIVKRWTTISKTPFHPTMVFHRVKWWTIIYSRYFEFYNRNEIFLLQFNVLLWKFQVCSFILIQAVLCIWQPQCVLCWRRNAFAKTNRLGVRNPILLFIPTRNILRIREHNLIEILVSSYSWVSDYLSMISE